MIDKVDVDIIISQGIQVQQNGMQQQQLIINPTKVIRSPYIPTALSLTITFVIVGLKNGESHHLKVSIKHIETGYVAFSNDSDATAPTGTDNMVINADLKNIGFEHEGEYEASLYIDGKKFFNNFYVLEKEKWLEALNIGNNN